MRIASATVLIGLAALAIGVGMAHARLPAGGGTVDLLTEPSVRFDGAAGERSGRSLAGGDFNGDGRPDLAIGVQDGDTAGRMNNGYVAVVMNRPTGQNLLPAVQAFRVDGAADDDMVGRSLASPGDVNGDRIDDLLVGSGDPNNAAPGYAAVVFGKRDAAAVDLANIGNQGFRLNGGGADRAGLAVGRASGLFGGHYRDGTFLRGVRVASGDINGDSLADLLVASPFAGTMGRNDNGVVNVVFGKRDTAPVDLRNLGAGGYRIHGASDNNFLGLLGVAAGDVNGDGRADIVTGRSGGQGAAYAVFGDSTTPPVDVDLLGFRGYTISSANLTDPRVTVTGDMNGDARDEVVIGAPMADNNGRNNSGSVIVAFGKAGTAAIDLANFGGRGISIDGGAGNDQVGTSVAAGDVNRDGRGDVIAGAPEEDGNGRNNSGAAYLFAGRPTPGNVDLVFVAGASGGVWKTNGAVANDRLGDDNSVGLAGDWDGDGRDDIGVGAASADNNGNNSGSSYVVFAASPLPGRCANPFTGTIFDDQVRGTPQGDNIMAGRGNDTIALGAGDDCGAGESGNDRISGDNGNDVLTGGTRGDRLKGGRGRDRLAGDSGNDRLDGGRNRDRFSGGSGNDRILARDGVRDVVNCGSGRRDSVSADRRDRVARNCERVRRR
jgi:hypothetical protein